MVIHSQLSLRKDEKKGKCIALDLGQDKQDSLVIDGFACELFNLFQWEKLILTSKR